MAENISYERSNNLGRTLYKELQHAERMTRHVNGPNNIHSYPAKMLKSIPEVIIPRFSKPGNTVLDPFCGSGTVLLESKLKNRNALGFDINPLAVLISNVKTREISQRKVAKLKNMIIENLYEGKAAHHIDFPNKNYWFTPAAERQLSALLAQINKIKDKNYKEFFLVCFSASIRYASRADPEIVPPVISKHMKVILKGRKVNVIKRFSDLVDRNAAALSKLPKTDALKICADVGDARKLPINGSSVELILTSPPYISAQKYPRSLKLELFWTGLTDPKKLSEVDRKTIGTERVSMLEKTKKIDDKTLHDFLQKIQKKNKERFVITYRYFVDMRMTIQEFYRVLKPGGYFVLLIGENTVCGIKSPTSQVLENYAEMEGFSLVTRVEDKIKTFGFMTKRNKTAGIINTEKLLVFKK